VTKVLRAGPAPPDPCFVRCAQTLALGDGLVGDTIRYIYSEFVLRDLLGYAVPGGIIMFAGISTLGLWPRLKAFTKDWPVAHGVGAQLLVLAFAYILGQSLAGISLNLIPRNPVFAYWPPSRIDSNIAEAQHVAAYNLVLATFSDAARAPIAAQRERYAVLTHLTATSGAACLVIVILGVARWRRPRFRTGRVVVVAAVTFVGLEAQHLQARARRFDFECSVIRRAPNPTDPLLAPAIKRCR